MAKFHPQNHQNDPPEITEMSIFLLIPYLKWPRMIYIVTYICSGENHKLFSLYWCTRLVLGVKNGEISAAIWEKMVFPFSQGGLMGQRMMWDKWFGDIKKEFMISIDQNLVLHVALCYMCVICYILYVLYVINIL